ncbi:MAG: hypothetical protein WDN28_04525 [Chthoniobacter sp.]
MSAGLVSARADVMGKRKWKVVPASTPAYDVHAASVARHNAQNDRETESGSTLPFGGEERLHAPFDGAFIHARPGVGNAQQSGVALVPGLNANLAAVGQRIDRIENQIGEQFAQFRRIAGNPRQFREIHLDLDANSPGQSLITPTWHRQGNGLLGQNIEIHRGERFHAQVGLVEFAEPPNRLSRILPRRHDFFDVVRARRVLEQQLTVPQDRREGIVEIVGDAAGHDPQGAEPFPLDHLALARAQADERLFELAGSFLHPLLEEHVVALQFQVKKARFEQIPDADDHFSGVQRLVQKVLGAGLESSQLDFWSFIAGEDQDRKIILLRNGRSQLLQHLEAVEVRHEDIEQQNIGMKLLKRPDRVARVVDDMDFKMPFPLQHSLQELRASLVVIHEQYPGVIENAVGKIHAFIPLGRLLVR